MLWLLFPLLALASFVIFLALPFHVAAGYLMVIVWVAFMLTIIFYRKDRVSLALQKQLGKSENRSNGL